MASGVVLAGLPGTPVEQVAAGLAALTGWPIERERQAAAPEGEGASPACRVGWSFALDGQLEGLRVLVTGSWPVRIRRIARERQLGEAEAAGVAAAEERELDQRARRAGWAGAQDPERFDIVVSTDRLAPDAAARVVAAALAAVAGTPGGPPGGASREVAREPSGPGALPEPASRGAGPGRVNGATVVLDETGAPRPIHHPNPPGRPVSFAHPSEEEFARVLDFYRVAWQYEPTTFPLEWDENGRILSAFTPDFYLPEWNLYVELTTMKQGLVSRKNRKIRRLKQLYPGVHIKIFYGRDFQRLLRKFGT